jgi:hypothetical protein
MYYPVWDQQVQEAVSCMTIVPQLLWPLLDDSTREALENYLQGRTSYKSILSLRAQSEPEIINMAALKVKRRRKVIRIKARAVVGQQQSSLH